MFLKGAPRPPRNLVAAITGITVVPLAVLLWLGWRLLDQDRLLENQRAQERLERAADLAASALQRLVSGSEQRVTVSGNEWPAGAVALTFGRDRMEADPPGRLAYLPVAPTLPEPPPSAFAAGEELEFRRHDRDGAIAVYRQLAKSPDAAVRAGALLRLARNLKSDGRTEEALTNYAELSRMDGVAVAGTPMGLIAEYARCEIYAESGRGVELRREADKLAGGLGVGRWPLTNAAYWLYAQDAAKWTGGESHGPLPSEIFAAAAAELWNRRTRMTPSGREALTIEGRKLAAIWQTERDSLRVLLATPEFVETQWLAPARQPGTNIALATASLTLERRALRGTADTGLPWPIAVTYADPTAPDAEFVLRRRLLVAGFGLLALMALAASYLIFRAVNRELAVARLQSDFVAAVSHEFRTPLTTIRQFTDMLRNNRNLAEERRRLCYDAQARATDRLIRLVESLLDFGRMEAGARTFRFERSDCSELVRQTVDEFRRDASSAKYEIEVQAESAAETEVDIEALARAVWNLLENAVKYSPEQRSVAVGVERCNGCVRIAVRDYGIGIPADERSAIFARFRRGEEARKLGIKGTGIGLAMVDQIVRAHQGRIELESELGRGSTFTIVLPVKEPQWHES